MNVLVTGAAGFIGSTLTRLLLAEGFDVTALDALTYAGNLENLNGVLEHVRFIKGDIREASVVRDALADVSAVLHLAAESHVDRSIIDGRNFLDTNVIGTQILLDAARHCGVDRFVQVSTDEVYGTLGAAGLFTEETPLRPSSPYSASKAAADLLALAHHETYGLPVVVTRCSNNYGPYQFPEKLIPLTVIRAMRRQVVPVYGDGRNIRDWIHVEDHCRGVVAALRHGVPGRVYNFGASQERTNIELVRLVLTELDAPANLIRFVADRPGHDFRYAIDSTRAKRELAWRPRWTVEDGVSATVKWYQEHQEWWRRLLSEDYESYIQQQYGSHLDARA